METPARRGRACAFRLNRDNQPRSLRSVTETLASQAEAKTNRSEANPTLAARLRRHSIESDTWADSPGASGMALRGAFL
jgi:hypothetical protein